MRTNAWWMGMLAALLLAAGCPSEPDEPEEPTPAEGPVGYWTDADGVYDEHGRQLMLRGANVPTQDSTAADFDQLAGWGLNISRQIYFWADVEPVEGQIDEAFLAKLDSQVALARDAGMYVLIDHHQHCYGVGFDCWGMPAWTCDQQYYDACDDDPWNYFCDGMEACFELFWTGEDLKQKYLDHLVLLAERYADEPAVIGFDIINEPWCAHTTLEECGAVMGDLYSDAAEQIGAVAPDKLVFFEPNFIELAGLDTHVTPLRVPNKGVYAAHYYLMSVHDGADYDGDPWQIALNIELRKAEAEAFDVPLFLGEFGGMTSVANFDQYIDDHLDLFDETLSGSAYWLYAEGDGFHMLDEDGNEKPFLDTLVRPFPQATPGRLTALSYDRETRVMEMEVVGNPDATAPGSVFVPQRHYAEGIEWSGCQLPDCTWSHDPEAQTLTFTVDTAQALSLRLSPAAAR